MKSFFSTLILLTSLNLLQAQSSAVTIIDTRHYSRVFGEVRNYRVFLPPGYSKQSDKRYPVIYYYHGWSQRYFGETYNKYAGIDQGSENQGDNIRNFVGSHEVIVVKPDGYNRSPTEEYYLRPYNVSPVESSRQFPLYFPELVEYIDANYRTLPDREHRGISGLSMGGFMTFWIAGKYPHLVSAAGNFCGSPEFSVGPKDFPVEFKHANMYKNYLGVNTRLHYGDKDFIRGYHQDLNRTWTQVMNNYHFKIFEAEHTPCGLSEMFQFILNTFEDPPDPPQRWHHIDAYPAFDVWGYQVQSDRNQAGFTVLNNVDRQGFQCAVQEYLPDGPCLPHVQVSVTTASIYQPGKPYTITDLNPITNSSDTTIIYSDHLGRLKITLDGGTHHIGINSSPAPNIGLASYRLLNTAWASKNQPIKISLSLLNKGTVGAEKITVKLIPTRTTTTIKKQQAAVASIPAGEIMEISEAFSFEVANDSTIDMVQFQLQVQADGEYQWIESLEIPVHAEVDAINDYVVADGGEFTVATAGDDTTTMVLGHGNGDGMINPGESFVILVPHQGIYYRTQLYSNHPHLNPKGMRLRKSDSWSSYDHVGGSAKYSIPLVAADCPSGQSIKLLAEYWLPSYPYHLIRKGEINVTVSGSDQTPPLIQWVNVLGDNTLQVKLHDGSPINTVLAKLVPEKEPDQVIEISLNDQGTSGDRTPGDHVFSYQISNQQFGLFHVQIIASDQSGNQVVKDWIGKFVVQ